MTTLRGGGPGGLTGATTTSGAVSTGSTAIEDTGDPANSTEGEGVDRSAATGAIAAVTAPFETAGATAEEAITGDDDAGATGACTGAEGASTIVGAATATAGAGVGFTDSVTSGDADATGVPVEAGAALTSGSGATTLTGGAATAAETAAGGAATAAAVFGASGFTTTAP